MTRRISLPAMEIRHSHLERSRSGQSAHPVPDRRPSALCRTSAARRRTPPTTSRRSSRPRPPNLPCRRHRPLAHRPPAHSGSRCHRRCRPLRRSCRKRLHQLRRRPQPTPPVRPGARRRCRPAVPGLLHRQRARQTDRLTDFRAIGFDGPPPVQQPPLRLRADPSASSQSLTPM